jgi:biotin carboxylase
VPEYCRFPLDADPRQLLATGALRLKTPVVLKPLALSGSRGVIRADTPEEFIRAFERIRALLTTPEVGVLREDTSNFIQVETYIDGPELAVEAIVDRGRLRVLAIVDKPAPLTGPFFEETIYVTPSRLREEAQRQIVATLAKAVAALGLHHGPMHAELRVNPAGIWIMGVAARSIGGLCSRALRFEIPLVDKEIFVGGVADPADARLGCLAHLSRERGLGSNDDPHSGSRFLPGSAGHRGRTCRSRH